MTIIFDFDGTLANTLSTLIDIYNNYIVKEFRCKPFDHSRLEEFQKRRPSEFMKDFGITPLKLPFIAVRARNLLKQEMPNVEAFQGIVYTIHQLKEKGIQLGIVTSNSEKNARLFLQRYQIEQYFDFVNGGRSLISKKKALLRIIKNYQIDTKKVLYIGDEIRDISSCREVGIPVAAVMWGNHHPDLLKAHQPDWMLQTPQDILDLVVTMI
jgi:phosphoglycolate phosphatase